MCQYNSPNCSCEEHSFGKFVFGTLVLVALLASSGWIVSVVIPALFMN